MPRFRMTCNPLIHVWSALFPFHFVLGSVCEDFTAGALPDLQEIENEFLKLTFSDTGMPSKLSNKITGQSVSLRQKVSIGPISLDAH